jgi:hypothetical protein
MAEQGLSEIKAKSDSKLAYFGVKLVGNLAKTWQQWLYMVGS